MWTKTDLADSCVDSRIQDDILFEILEVSKCGASSLLWATPCAHLSQV
jgi:hypothetical protein